MTFIFYKKNKVYKKNYSILFNDLYETRRQMVFTCDRPINELKSMTDRLKSRFSRGINVDLRPPEYETKVKILRVKK